MIRAEWTNNDALSTEQATQTNAPNALNAFDCVSRQAAIDVITVQKGVVDKSVAKRVLYQLPSAQPERKHGKWEVCNILDYAQRPTGRRVGRCSHCGHLTDEFRKIVESSKKLTNFCPNCGADMREETEDAEKVN